MNVERDKNRNVFIGEEFAVLFISHYMCLQRSRGKDECNSIKGFMKSVLFFPKFHVFHLWILL